MPDDALDAEYPTDCSTLNRKTLAQRGRPHMTKPFRSRTAGRPGTCMVEMISMLLTLTCVGALIAKAIASAISVGCSTSYPWKKRFLASAMVADSGPEQIGFGAAGTALSRPYQGPAFGPCSTLVILRARTSPRASQRYS